MDSSGFRFIELQGESEKVPNRANANSIQRAIMASLGTYAIIVHGSIAKTNRMIGTTGGPFCDLPLCRIS